MSADDNPNEAAAPGQQGAAEGNTPAARRSAERGRRRDKPGGANMLPQREGRRFALERMLVRLVATTGIIGVGVALGAILTSQKVTGWIIGLVVAVVTVVLSAILWSSRQL